MMEKTVKKNLKWGGYILFNVLVLSILLLPFVAMVGQSFMTPRESLILPIKLFPTKWTFESYIKALDDQVIRGLQNTLLLIACNMVLIPISGYIVAYGFAKLEFFGKNFCFSLGMSTMIIPGIVLMVPRYVLFADLGWLNTLYPFIIPNFFGGGMMNIFLMYNFLRGIPNVYREAARMDGASELRIAFLITMPMAKPIMTYIMFGVVSGVWNDFTGPLTYINRTHSDLWTLGVVVFDKFKFAATDLQSAPSLKAALSVVMMLPTVTLFAFFQKTIMQGVVFTGIKG